MIGEYLSGIEVLVQHFRDPLRLRHRTVQPAGLTKVVIGPVERIDPDGGESYCLVQVVNIVESLLDHDAAAQPDLVSTGGLSGRGAVGLRTLQEVFLWQFRRLQAFDRPH